MDIGDTMTLCTGADQVTFTVVSAGTDGTAAGGVPVTEENDRGLCFHIEYHDFDMVTCSDINGVNDGSRTDVESVVAPIIGDVEVVKVNHHGSSYSSNATYVNTLHPEVSVISVGKNSYGHPSPTVVARWDTVSEVFQTQSPARQRADRRQHNNHHQRDRQLHRFRICLEPIRDPTHGRSHALRNGEGSSRRWPPHMCRYVRLIGWTDQRSEWVAMPVPRTS